MNLPPEVEATLAGWRDGLQRVGITSRTTLDELESHLRERLLDRMESGENPQAALDEAIGKLGSPETLKQEFARVGTDRRLSHFVLMWVGLGTVLLIVIWWCVAWFSAYFRWTLWGVAPSIAILPFVFAFTAYHTAAWRSQVAGGWVSRGRALASLRVALWATGAIGLVWWSSAMDWLLSLLVTYFLVGLLVTEAAAIAGLARHIPRRIRFDVIAALVILIMLVSSAWTNWPMRILFHLSRARLESLAAQVETGQSIEAPLWAGGFRIARLERRNADWRGGTCLWVVSSPGAPTGFIRREKTAVYEPGNNVNRRIRLDERWYFVSED